MIIGKSINHIVRNNITLLTKDSLWTRIKESSDSVNKNIITKVDDISWSPINNSITRPIVPFQSIIKLNYRGL